MSDHEDEPGNEGSTDPPDDVRAAEETVIEAFARSAEVYGASRSLGRLYGELFFADEPLSLDELVERSGYAKSTVSTAMSTLERFHLVQRRSLPNEGKRAFFEAERDFWYIAREFLQNEVRREVTVMSRALDEAAQQLADAEGERAERDLERVEQLRSVYERSERYLDLLASTPVDRLLSLLDRGLGRGDE
ncbi:GbsR/MarR family transcriptional regulator [Haloglomus halophilum]|uniref:GbsR/MarR family transcriptional regulator n=1 Tax=Haloglomus halophilum TaxID=2962672 RepID=UPI0020C949F0|nr:helix-turn-helix domain-containing protein [Haloglomus halophilum]